MRTEAQTSAGGVVVRGEGDAAEVVLVSVGPQRRWQLPKGLVEPGEPPEQTAAREVHEEAGVEADLVAPIDVIEYGYVATRGRERVRYHKRVHFFLFRYRGGDVTDHDHEVHEARWVPAADAPALLAFANERQVAEKGLAIWSEGS
jgi:8-oxo-dGTP pyrophosphatase MutT (NUDIX family)